MRFGPMPANQAKEIETVLNQKGIPYSISVEDGLIVDVAEEHLAKIDDSLSALNLESLTRGGYEFLEEGGFHCPRCDHSASKAGLCPRHRITLLSFGEWIEARRWRLGRMQINLIRLALVIIVGAWMVAYLSRTAS
jgi:hypothetical protein